MLGVSAVIVAALTLFFRFTPTGRAMRACADDRMAARLCGINDRWMVTLSFMLSAGIGALAGCVISPVTQTQYDMGAPLAIKGFTVAILGGLGNSMAAVAAGLLLGLLEAFTVSQFAVRLQGGRLHRGAAADPGLPAERPVRPPRASALRTA